MLRAASARKTGVALVLTLAVLLVATTASAQESIHPKDPEAGVPLYKRKFMPPEGSLDWLPDGARIVATIKPSPPPVPEKIVIRYGPGGLYHEHNIRFYGYHQAGNKVEIRGPCMSACTLVAAHVPKERLCFAEGSFLAFHAVRSVEKREIMPFMTSIMYRQMPPDIRGWIDRTGGYANLPLDDFWFLQARELWEMGYPRCKP